MRQQRTMAQASAGRGLGGDSGFAANNQVQEAGQMAMEMTGAPALARGVQHVGRGEPGEAIPEFIMGGLGALGMATLPYGGGAYGAATRQPMGIRPNVAQALPEPMPPMNPPARLPGRATDGSVLPVRPPEPFRNSMRGGSDDLMSAARSGPDAGGAQGGRDAAGAGQGWVTDLTLYRGTRRAHGDGLRATRHGDDVGAGVYTTTSRSDAERYASKKKDGVVMELQARGPLADMSPQEYDRQFVQFVRQNDLDGSGDEIQMFADHLQSQGYTGMIVRRPGADGDYVVVFDPANLRRVPPRPRPPPRRPSQ